MTATSSLTNLPEFSLSKYVPELIGCGKYGGVYRVSPTLAAKIPLGFSFDTACNMRQLRDEPAIAWTLYRRGVSVPRPYGMMDIHFESEGVEYQGPAYIMEYIPGRPVGDIEDPNLYHRAREFQDSELRKAEQCGFKTVDAHDYNAIYQEDKNKIFLIDFGLWYVSWFWQLANWQKWPFVPTNRFGDSTWC